jgi:DNA-binding transcriptional regulator LsrR (DeoR family)
METIDLDNKALEIARAHLLKNISFRELGKTYYAAPATIHRRLMKWLKEDRFELRDKLAARPAAVIVSRDDELAETLVRQTGIWRARVARISGVEPAYTSQYQEKPDSSAAQAAYRASDELHHCLGEAAAELILNSLRKNMTIGISSGRGVGFAIERLGEMVRRTPSWASGYENCRLVSLCGGAHVGMWEFTNTRDFDADENVFNLSAVLRVPRSNVSYMSGPIAAVPQERRMERPKFSLDLVVFGLGQLNTQHHYLRDHYEMQLKAMSGPIHKIIEWQSLDPELLEGIAEIVLRLYPAGDRPLPQEYLDIIRETNSTILAAEPEMIKKAGETILIAGGHQKAAALCGILMGKCPEAPIDKKNLTLVTDSWTAETILNRIARQNRQGIN